LKVNARYKSFQMALKVRNREAENEQPPRTPAAGEAFMLGIIGEHLASNLFDQVGCEMGSLVPKLGVVQADSIVGVGRFSGGRVGVHY
jgi:hypothetical protein